MADVRDVVAALHGVANYGGDESARATVQGYLDETDPEREAVEAKADDYDSQRKADLVDLAEERGIDSSGTKADVVARLREADAPAAPVEPSWGFADAPQTD